MSKTWKSSTGFEIPVDVIDEYLATQKKQLKIDRDKDLKKYQDMVVSLKTEITVEQSTLDELKDVFKKENVALIDLLDKQKEDNTKYYKELQQLEADTRSLAKRVEGKEKVLDEKNARITSGYDQKLAYVLDREKEVIEKSGVVVEREKKVMQKESALNENEKQIKAMAFSLDEKIAEFDRIDVANKNALKVMDEKRVTLEEVQINLDKTKQYLADIQSEISAKEKKVNRLAELNSEFAAALDQEKQAFNVEKEKVEEEKAGLKSLSVDLTEKDKTLHDQERLIKQRERDLNSKISTLKELRKE